MTLPNFLCIGATKAGTTWLHEQLTHHPHICMPMVKELHYFSSVYLPKHKNWAADAVTTAMKRELRHARKAKESGGDAELVAHMRHLLQLPIFTPEWYEACFSRPGKSAAIYGEITPAYAELPLKGIQGILAMSPDVKVIHMLRHPLDRALSHLRMTVFRRDGDASDDTLFNLLEKNTSILSRGEYHVQIPRWRTQIPPQRLKFVPFGLVKSEPLNLLRDIEDFLEVDHFSAYPTTKQVNSTKHIEISSTVRDYLEAKVQPAVDFIREEFGEDFLAMTR